MELSKEEKEGLEIFEGFWYDLAKRIVSLAIEIYKLDEQQASALKDVYLKPNLYTVSFYPK